MGIFNPTELIEFARAMDPRQLVRSATISDATVALRAALFPDEPETWTEGMPEGVKRSVEPVVRMAELAVADIRGGSNV